jgi:hypothetical protein
LQSAGSPGGGEFAPATRFRVRVSRDRQTMTQSIMGILLLAAGPGHHTISADGPTRPTPPR